MMVLFRNTYIADAAMFASSGFEETASATDLPRIEENMIVWIVAHLLPVVLGSNHRRSGGDRLVDKDIRNKAENQGCGTMSEA